MENRSAGKARGPSHALGCQSGRRDTEEKDSRRRATDERNFQGRRYCVGTFLKIFVKVKSNLN